MTDRPAPDDAWLRARDLDFFHGRQRVLRKVNLDLRPGRHYVVAGPNGAGKSTLLDLLANLKNSAGGELLVMGRKPADYGPGGMARILALAPQEYQLNFAFSIEEVVSMGRRPYLDRWGRLDEEDLRCVAEAVAAMGLAGIAHKAVTRLSGGERRRCVVARALAQATPILLLDEPSSGLDIGHALAVMALARRLAEEGKLVVTVSHDLNLAAVFAHEIVFLKEGAVAAAGPVAEVFADAVLERVYETEARVRRDDFAGGLAVSFRVVDGR